MSGAKGLAAAGGGFLFRSNAHHEDKSRLRNRPCSRMELAPHEKKPSPGPLDLETALACAASSPQAACITQQLVGAARAASAIEQAADMTQRSLALPGCFSG
ncbi:hypothetical protein BN871_EP_00200 [Paenibacillus sp. P22]|nr:hypothetical protein BN871_EP_00200 [Paenibacillus sp. P22]